jgi:hypothetical protein
VASWFNIGHQDGHHISAIKPLQFLSHARS